MRYIVVSYSGSIVRVFYKQARGKRGRFRKATIMQKQPPVGWLQLIEAGVRVEDTWKQQHLADSLAWHLRPYFGICTTQEIEEPMDYRKANRLLHVKRNQTVETLGNMQQAFRLKMLELQRNRGTPAEMQRVTAHINEIQQELDRRTAQTGEAK